MGMQIYRFFRMTCLLALCTGWLFYPMVASAKSGSMESIPELTPATGHPLTLYIAQAEDKSTPETTPKSGTLVMPSDFKEQEEKKEKTCIRVCSNWGETCVYDINKGRKCRRTCKETSMECFDK